MNIGEAVAAMKEGKTVRRASWHRADCVFLDPIDKEGKRDFRYAENGNKSLARTGHLFTVDILADDWIIL